MRRLIKPIVLAICLSIIAFILMEKIKPEYTYYAHKFMDGNPTKDGYYTTVDKWEEVTQEEYTKIGGGKTKKKYTLPIIFSIAVAVASFTLLYKQKSKN